MDKQLLLLAANMLELASKQFSNNGCNDLSEEAMSLVTDDKKLCDGVRRWNGDEDCEYPKTANWITDSNLMFYLSDKLKEEVYHEARMREKEEDTRVKKALVTIDAHTSAAYVQDRKLTSEEYTDIKEATIGLQLKLLF